MRKCILQVTKELFDRIIFVQIGIRHWLIDGEWKLDVWQLLLLYNRLWRSLDNVDGERELQDGTVATNGQWGGRMRGTSVSREEMGRRVDGIVRITRDEADEMMLQEAIRQSLQQRKRNVENERKRETEEAEGSNNTTATASSSIPRYHFNIIISNYSLRSSSITTISSTSPPSPRSIFSAFRTRSGSGSSRNGASPPSNPFSQSTTRRPSSTNNLYPPKSTQSVDNLPSPTLFSPQLRLPWQQQCTTQ